ncbi:hypothetical protein AB0K16_42270 [Nonomuraea jabiensis]
MPRVTVGRRLTVVGVISPAPVRLTSPSQTLVERPPASTSHSRTETSA